MTGRTGLVLGAVAALGTLGMLGTLVGCGGNGGASAHDVLARTASNVGRIRSGTLDFRLVLTPRARVGKGRIGFTLHGPFALRGGSLPVLHVTYTQLAGEKSASATLVSNGKTAYAESAGRTVRLSAAQLGELRSASAAVTGGGGVVQVPIERWIDHPKVADGGMVGGAATDRVSADLKVVEAANGLIDLLRSLGRQLPHMTGASADQLRKSVRSSSFDVWTGKHDRLLRRLRITANLGFDVPRKLKRALGELVGARFEFELGVSRPKTRP